MHIYTVHIFLQTDLNTLQIINLQMYIVYTTASTITYFMQLTQSVIHKDRMHLRLLHERCSVL